MDLCVDLVGGVVDWLGQCVFVEEIGVVGYLSELQVLELVFVGVFDLGEGGWQDVFVGQVVVFLVVVVEVGDVDFFVVLWCMYEVVVVDVDVDVVDVVVVDLEEYQVVWLQFVVGDFVVVYVVDGVGGLWQVDVIDVLEYIVDQVVVIEVFFWCGVVLVVGGVDYVEGVVGDFGSGGCDY